MSVPVLYQTTEMTVEPLQTRAYNSRAGVMFDEALRRSLDVILSCIALVCLFPVFLAIAVCIRLDSSGPILYIHNRVGKNGQEFPFFKFRSMRIDADQVRDLLMDVNEASGPLFKIRRDPRITKVGRFLRRSSLDELPQLLNVLRGEMTLVGPRPALPKEVADYSKYERQRLNVTPGLTGLWQVSGRSDLSFEQAIALDMEYITRRSVWFDFMILLRTIPAVCGGKGAY